MIKKLKPRPEAVENTKLYKAYRQFENLIDELSGRELPYNVIAFINNSIDELNAISVKNLRKEIKKKQSKIVTLIEKELKIVTKNHYRNTWMALGMAAFGVPLGVAFGASLGNMGLIGIGLPIGMVIGLAIGTAMDKKAYDEGRQLKMELQF